MQTGTDSDDENNILPLLEQRSPEPSKSILKPLPFERLIAGIASKSQARLLQLPFDILDEIFKHVPSRSLPSFALASRDCCRLARGRQFTNVTLDYSPNSWSLAHSLLAEANLGHDPVSRPARLPSIGPAVRQITIRTAKEYIQQYHSISIWDIRSISRDKLKEIKERYKRYIRTIQLVLANSLPNIETIVWIDRLSFDDATSQALFQSRAQHLTLSEIEDDARINIHACTTLWPLRTLNLGFDDSLGHQTEAVWNAMIRPSAPHLEALTWTTGHGYRENLGFAVQGSTFPALRRLHLAGLGFIQDSLYESLFSPDSRLRWLGVQQKYVGHYLSQRGTLSSLESLTWLIRPAEGDDDPLSFLKSNTHLKELYFRRPFATDTLDTNLLPLLGSRFNNLTSLSLVGEGEVFEESSLELVGKIRNLELLHLSAGDHPFYFQWIVDHEAIRRHLSNLTKLRTLLFSRDNRTTVSVSSSEDDDDASSLDSDGDTSSMNFDDNPNTDLDAIIAAVAHGTALAPALVQHAAHATQQNPGQHNEHDEHDEHDDRDTESDASDEGIGWDFAATSRRSFSVTGSGRELPSLSRLLQQMKDEKVEQEAQAYFSAFEKLEMVYIGRQAFDRGHDEMCGRLWKNKRWADLEALLPSMMGTLAV